MGEDENVLPKYCVRKELREVWFDGNGHAFLEEWAARLSPANRDKKPQCEQCGAECEYSNQVRCRDCYEKLAREKWLALPHDWPAIDVPVYSDARDEYYNSVECAYDDVDEGHEDELRLYICEPVYPDELTSENWDDDLARDHDDDINVPPEFEAAITEFNEKVKGIVLSYKPSGVRVSLPHEIGESNG